MIGGYTGAFTVQKQHMEMNIQIQRTAEALDQHHCAGLCHGFGVTGFVGHMRGNGRVDDAQHLVHHGGLAGEQEAQWKGDAEDPRQRAKKTPRMRGFLYLADEARSGQIASATG